MRHVDLAFDRGHLGVDLPEGVHATVLHKTAFAKLPDGRAAVIDALANPVGSAPYAELVKGRKSACIVICDITRPVPNHLFLRPLIEGLLGAGTPASEIKVLIATGLHRPNLGEELEELIGDPWVTATVEVLNHYARDDAAMVDLGPTPTRGTPVFINRVFMDADLRVVTGLVEPHFMAGWSGGRKVIAPGVAGHQTIRTFHSSRFMSDPLAVQCNLIGNPLHEEQLEVLKKVGEAYAVNTVLDEDRDLVKVSFGEVLASHADAVAFVEHSVRAPAPRRYKTVVTSSAGYPLDKTYYQTIKSMVTPLDILEPGGTLIVASACSEGFGSPEFREAQGRLVELGPDRFLATIAAKTLADIDEWQTEMQLKPMRKGRIQLYAPGLTAAEQALTGVEIITDLAAAIAQSVAASGDPAVAFIPEGPYVVPRLI